MNSSTPDDERPRTPLSSRLGSLFIPTENAESDTDHSDSSMLSTRTAARPKASSLSKRRSLPASLPRLQSLTSPSMVTEPAQSKSPSPVIRWLGPWGSDNRKRTSGSGSSSPSGSAPPSPSLTCLNEALSEDILPTSPPKARLPSSFYASRTLSRPPPFLDNLTRSTLPTSSLSPGLHHPHDPNTTQTISLTDPTPPSPTAQIISHSPPGSRSSMDTLRSVRDRSIHTSAPQSNPIPSRQNSWWWSQSNNKHNVDTLLEEDDRAASVGEEQSKLQKKCKIYLLYLYSNILMHYRPLHQKPYRLLPRSSGFRHSLYRAVNRPSPSDSLARNQRGIRGQRDRSTHHKGPRYEQSCG